MSLEIISNDTLVEQAEHVLATASPEELEAANEQRWATAQDMRQLRSLVIHAPQLPDQEARDIYEQVIEAEARVVGQQRRLADYGEGTATVEDEFVVEGRGFVLAETQHATDPVRKSTNARGSADYGTGGLGLVLARHQILRTVVSIGRQTGNANVNLEHPLKDRLVQEFKTEVHDGFLSLHGCYAGKVTSPEDCSEVHAVIGLGKEPNEESWEAAEKVVAEAHDRYGLRVIIGNQTAHFNHTPTGRTDVFRNRDDHLERTPEGLLIPTKLASLMAGSTTSFMAGQAAKSGRQGFVSMQMEMSASLRLTPTGAYERTDPSAEYMGVYLGYKLGSIAAEMCINPNKLSTRA